MLTYYVFQISFYKSALVIPFCTCYNLKELVRCLGEWSPIPCTYAGGGKSLEDLKLVNELSNGRVDLTFGSALDIFGGSGVKYADCVAWNNAH